jgi:hypothetical protein
MPKPQEIEQMFRPRDLGHILYCGCSSFHAWKCRSGGISLESSSRMAPERNRGRRLRRGEIATESQFVILLLSLPRKGKDQYTLNIKAWSLFIKSPWLTTGKDLEQEKTTSRSYLQNFI